MTNFERISLALCLGGLVVLLAAGYMISFAASILMPSGLTNSIDLRPTQYLHDGQVMVMFAAMSIAAVAGLVNVLILRDTRMDSSFLGWLVKRVYMLGFWLMALYGLIVLAIGVMALTQGYHAWFAALIAMPALMFGPTFMPE